MTFKFPECGSCAFHEVEPAICDDCEDADQYEPWDEEARAELAKVWSRITNPVKQAA